MSLIYLHPVIQKSFLCVSMCVEAKGQLWLSFLGTLTTFLETKSLTDLEFSSWCRLAGQQAAPGILLSPQHWIISLSHVTSLFKKIFYLKVLFIFSLWLWVFACKYVCVPCMSEEGVGSPGAEITGSCRLPCGCWDPNTGSLKSS